MTLPFWRGEPWACTNNPVYRDHRRCYELTERNIPFELAVAGDELLQRRLHRDSLTDVELVIVPEPMQLDVSQQTKQDHDAQPWQAGCHRSIRI